ncbi:hypothetical protein DFH29DRAFT_903289 [Suillus ampliporus]|nr:hypothetical protein DFH29DRAFT_903289 [Suillus ampliporus]
MMLDGLAVTENEKGLRWFMEPIAVSEHIRKQVVSPHTPTLDKLLTQYALPLPFLVTPSMSFLVWLSPRAYLQLLRSSPPSKQPSMWNVDIPITHLKTSLLDSLEDVTIVTLRLVPSAEVAASNINSSDVSGDHMLLTAPSHMWVLDFTAKLPQNGVVMSQNRMRVIQRIVESRVIDLNSMASMSSMGSMSSLGNMSNMHFGDFGVAPSHGNGGSGGTGTSWLDLLVNKNSSTEYYTATYKSPSGIHPPLHLRLLAPQEPGFLLQKVPVRSVKQVSRVLEVVREQCWLNESLSIHHWSPETSQVLQSHQRPSNVEQQPENAASSALLASVLAGTVTPQSIPVNVYLPSSSLSALSQQADPFTSQHSGLGMGPPASAGSSSGASLFGTGDLEMDMDIPGLSMSMGGTVDMDLGMDLSTPPDPMQQPHSSDTCPPPMIVLSSPRSVPRSGLVEIRVTSGGHGSIVGENGIRVEASPGVETGYMPDVVRRGGVWSLPGRVWNKGS